MGRSNPPAAVKEFQCIHGQENSRIFQRVFNHLPALLQVCAFLQGIVDLGEGESNRHRPGERIHNFNGGILEHFFGLHG